MERAVLPEQVVPQQRHRDSLRQSPFVLAASRRLPLELPSGQFTHACARQRPSPCIMFGVLRMVTNPRPVGRVGTGLSQPGSCGASGSDCGVQPGGGDGGHGAPSVLNSTPAEAVVSFEITVLLTNLTLQRVLQGHAAAIPASDVVRDDVVGDASRRSSASSCSGKAMTSWPFTSLQTQAAAGTALGAVAHDQVGVDQQVAAGALGESRRAVQIVHAAAFLSAFGR